MPITNFEEHTADLSEDEMMFKDEIKAHFEKLLSNTPHHQTKQVDLVQSVNMMLVRNHGAGSSVMLNTTRLRKYFNYFRSNGVLPIVATSKGCYITTDKEEVQKQITSLEERARQIQRAADGLKAFLL